MHYCLRVARPGNGQNVLEEARQDGKAAADDAQGDFGVGPHDAFDLMICVVGCVDEYGQVRDADDTCSARTASDCQ